jgi:hypothetical protein
MLILPTMGRPQNLERFVSLYHLRKCTLPVYVVLDAADADNYESVALPSHFKVICVPGGTRLGDIYNMVFRDFPDEDFYGMVSDDCIPETDEWDVKLRDACLPDKVVWPSDGFVNERMPICPFFGGDLIRKLGFWSPGDMQHWYTDNAWMDIARGLGKAVYMPDIRIIHYHPANGNAENDATYANQPNTTIDKIAYESWKRFEFPSLMERMKAA